MAYQQAVRQREGLFLPTKSTHKIELLLLNLKKKINQTTKEIKEDESFMYNEGKRSQGARERLTHKTFTRLSILCFPSGNFANGWWHGKLSVADHVTVFYGIWPCRKFSASFIVGFQIFAPDGQAS